MYHCKHVNSGNQRRTEIHSDVIDPRANVSQPYVGGWVLYRVWIGCGCDIRGAQLTRS